MSSSTPNLALVKWDSNDDTFDHVALASNWDKIDADYTRARPANQAESVTSVPASANFEGRLVYLTAADSGFAAGTLLRFHNSTFAPVPGVEVLPSVPTLSNFAGRMVLLTAASGSFAQWAFIRFDGVGWSIVNNTYEILSAVPTSNNFAGRLVMLSTASGGFNAWDLIRFDGSIFKLVGPQPNPPGTQYTYTSITSDMTTSNTADPGDVLSTWTATTFENVQYYLQLIVPALTSTVASATVEFRLRDLTTSPFNVGNPILIDMPSVVGKRAHMNTLIPFTPVAGTRIYSVTWWVNSGSATINTTGLAPATVRIIKA